MVKIPSGFRFNPKDDEVIKFLECKAKDEPLPVEGVILEADLYGEKEPWEIFQELGGKNKKSRYFFTRLKKIKENGSQYVRRVGLCGGTWNPGNKGKPIYGDPGYWTKTIGMKKTLLYLNRKLKRKREGGDDDDQVDQRYKWLMTEFTLSGDSLKDPNLKHLDYAVCLIRKKNKCKKGHNDDDSDDSDDDDEGDDILAQILDDQKSSVEQMEIGKEEPMLYANPFQVTINIDQKSDLAQAEIGNENPVLYTNPFHVTNNDHQKSCHEQVEIGNEDSQLYTNPFQMINNRDSNVSGNYQTKRRKL